MNTYSKPLSLANFQIPHFRGDFKISKVGSFRLHLEGSPICDAPLLGVPLCYAHIYFRLQ